MGTGPCFGGLGVSGVPALGGGGSSGSAVGIARMTGGFGAG